MDVRKVIEINHFVLEVSWERGIFEESILGGGWGVFFICFFFDLFLSYDKSHGPKPDCWISTTSRNGKDRMTRLRLKRVDILYPITGTGIIRVPRDHSRVPMSRRVCDVDTCHSRISDDR